MQAGARLVIFHLRAPQPVAGSRLDQMNRGAMFTNPRERVATALGARLPLSEATMKNRTMAAKLERARVQAREAAAIEFGKACYWTHPSKPELGAMVSGFDGLIRQFVPGLRRAEPALKFGLQPPDQCETGLPNVVKLR
jgi:hypothetical protein